MRDCHTLLYRSVSFIDTPEVINSVWEILRVSHKNNSRDGLTGLLVYDQGRFFQVLEGCAESIEACYSRIMSDSRHKNIETLSNHDMSPRMFSRWSMGFVDAYELDDYLLLHEGLRSRKPGDVYEAMVRIGREHGLVQRAVS